jgi:hypothetical protein
MVIDENGGLRRSESEYDKKVAGIICGAGDHRPAIILDAHAPTAQLLDDAVMRDGLVRRVGTELDGVDTGGNGMSDRKEGQLKPIVKKHLLQLRVLRFHLLQDGDVGVGVFTDGDKSTHGYVLRRPPEVDHPQNDERGNSV